MSQQVYNVGEQNTDNIVSVLSPVQTVLYSAYIAGEASALEYTTSSAAASDATYLNSLNNGKTYVVVGPHPKPH